MGGKHDRRMLWLRLADTATPDPSEAVQVLEADLASESSIVGEVEVPGGAIWMRPLSFTGADSKGLLKYALRAVLRRTEEADSDGTREGYIFPGGVVAELAALISLTLQVRVFVLSTTIRHVDHRGDRPLSKYEGVGLSQRANPWLDAVVFDRSERTFTKVVELLEKLRQVPERHHLAIATAAGRYAEALRRIDVDEELVIINLVSAIERLNGDQAIPDDPLKGLSVEDIVNPGLTAQQVAEVGKLIKHRGSQKRFVAFLETYSPGFFDGEKREPAHTQVTPENLGSVAKAIYDARSGYLHNGDPMWISRRDPKFPSWHMDPMVGMVKGDRRFAASQKLPRADFLHRLVRHCIMRRIDELAQSSVTPNPIVTSDHQ
jgi:hypothetical protein